MPEIGILKRVVYGLVGASGAVLAYNTYMGGSFYPDIAVAGVLIGAANWLVVAWNENSEEDIIHYLGKIGK